MKSNVITFTSPAEVINVPNIINECRFLKGLSVKPTIYHSTEWGRKQRSMAHIRTRNRQLYRNNTYSHVSQSKWRMFVEREAFIAKIRFPGNQRSTMEQMTYTNAIVTLPCCVALRIRISVVWSHGFVRNWEIQSIFINSIAKKF